MKLPQPNNIALQHSQKVEAHIADKIHQSGGTITFSDYMEQVLYAPGLGYYSAGCTKFGEHGDFITAPEISPLFSRCIAHAIVPIIGSLRASSILEVGAGSGKMAADIILELYNSEQQLDHYYILERSAELRERQQQTIQALPVELADKVTWLNTLPTVFNGVVLANELLDAMPVTRFQKNNQAVTEMFVGYKSGQFSWQNGTTSNTRLNSRIAAIESTLGHVLVEGYTSEVNFAAQDWLSSINDILETGYILLIDYGYPEKEYYHEQREQGTLSCFYQHGRHDNPFLNPGLQDITAHIDFSSLAQTVISEDNNSVTTSARLQLNAYTTQSNFLMASGLMQLVQENSQDDVKQQLVISQQVKKLTMPYDMGEVVKVIGFEKGLATDSGFELPCFAMRDLRYQL
ncbi:SAM-dependent methyltransferase, MidA [hydrothermal vent metagenome]|uniref:SAM-dependent methyltransferase, MidA n=1 Tax=hydrothermal vent metagenome TaxID=652676 RepID=A0A3B1AI85_9ZZZZ